MGKLKAHFKGIYKGKRIYLVPVEIFDCCNVEQCETMWILSSTATDAAECIINELEALEEGTRYEVTAYGPKGGEVKKYLNPTT